MITKLFSKVRDVLVAFLEKKDTVYQRYWYKEEMDFEERLASFFKAKAAAMFNSGMSAISTFIHQFIIFNKDFNKEDSFILVSDQLYSLTTEWFEMLKKFGFNVVVFNTADDYFYEFMKQDKVKVVFTEIFGNGPDIPKLDIMKLWDAMDENKELIAAVDITFAPEDDRLKFLFSDYSKRFFAIMSMTKYICQDQCTAGLIMGSAENIEPIKKARSMLGTYLPYSSLEKIPKNTLTTLYARLASHGHIAKEVIELLKGYDGVFINIKHCGGIIYCHCSFGPDFLKTICDNYGKISGSFGFEDTRFLPYGLFKEIEKDKDGLLRISVGYKHSNIDEIKAAIDKALM